MLSQYIRLDFIQADVKVSLQQAEPMFGLNKARNNDAGAQRTKRDCSWGTGTQLLASPSDVIPAIRGYADDVLALEHDYLSNSGSTHPA